MSITKVSLLAAMLLGLGLSTSAYAVPEECDVGDQRAKCDCNKPKNVDAPHCTDKGGGDGDVIDPTSYNSYCGGIATGVLNQLFNVIDVTEQDAIENDYGDDANCNGIPDSEEKQSEG